MKLISIQISQLLKKTTMKKIWTNPELRHEFFAYLIMVLMILSLTFYVWAASKAYILEGFDKLIKQW